MKSYTRAQVAELLGVEARKLEGWVARGVLQPQGSPQGSGHPHLFTFPEIVRAAILVEAQESLGLRFARPGFLSKLLHDQLSEREIDQERRRIERTPPERAAIPILVGRRRIGSLPAEDPDDLILHVYRKLLYSDAAGRGEGPLRRSSQMSLELTQRNNEHILPGSYVLLRIEVGPIVRRILEGVAQCDLTGQR